MSLLILKSSNFKANEHLWDIKWHKRKISETLNFFIIIITINWIYLFKNLKRGKMLLLSDYKFRFKCCHFDTISLFWNLFEWLLEPRLDRGNLQNTRNLIRDTNETYFTNKENDRYFQVRPRRNKVIFVDYTLHLGLIKLNSFYTCFKGNLFNKIPTTFYPYDNYFFTLYIMKPSSLSASGK